MEAQPVCCLLQSWIAVFGVMHSREGQVLAAATFARAGAISAEGHHVLRAAAAAAAKNEGCTAVVLLQEGSEHVQGQV